MSTICDFNGLPDLQSSEPPTDIRLRSLPTAALFGTKYIVLPNPMYGHWENALYAPTNSNKSVLRRDGLRGWEPGKK